MPKPKFVKRDNLGTALARSRLAKVLDDRKKAEVEKISSIVRAAENGNIFELSRLLDLHKDFDINSSVSSSGSNLLHLAASSNKYEVVDFLITREAINLNAQTESGATALYNAVLSNSFWSVKSLLEAGASPHIATTLCKETPLLLSAACGYSNIAELLIIHGAKINAKTSSGDTPLHQAARFSKDLSAELFLSYNADQNEKNNFGETALLKLLKAAKKTFDELIGKYTGLIDHMSQKGAVKLVVKLPNGQITKVDRELEGIFKTPEELLSFIEASDQEYTDLSHYHEPLKAFATNLYKELKEHSPYITDEKINSICTLEMIKYIGFSETIKIYHAQEKEIASLFRTIKLLVSNLEESAITLSLPDSEGNYPIALAASIGFSEIVEMLHERGVNIDFQNAIGKTPLMIALENDANIFKVLSDYSVTRRFHVNSESTVDYLIHNCTDLELLDYEGNSALYHAAYSGNIKAVRQMLEFEFNVDTINLEGMTPLLGSLQKNGNEEIVKLLLDAGANFAIADKVGISAIHVAATLGFTRTVEFLLDAGADVNQAIPEKGTTALMMALLTNHLDTALLLIHRGANKFAKDQVASTIHIASMQGFTDIVGLILDEKPDEINCLTEDRNTPLHLAASYNHFSIIKFLLKRGADTTIINSQGKTPLKCFLGDDSKTHPIEIKKAMVQLFLNSQKPIETAPEEDAGSAADSVATTITTGMDDTRSITGASTTTYEAGFTGAHSEVGDIV